MRRTGWNDRKPVRIYVMGEKKWRDEEEWPLTRARETRFYLHAERRLGAAARPQGGSGFDEYVYDPADPVPTTGGGLCCGALRAGAIDQKAIEQRKDVLVYTSAAFEKPVEITGPVRVELFVSSSAVDTDFTAILVDVWPNGFSQNLTDGVQRARYRISREKAQFLKPGEVVPLTIDMLATSNVFLPGHKLRVDITAATIRVTIVMPTRKKIRRSRRAG